MNIQVEEMCKARCWEGLRASVPWLGALPSQSSVYSVIQKLSNSYTFKIFMEASSCRRVSSQLSHQPLSPSLGMVKGLSGIFQVSNDCLVFGDQPSP